MQKFEAKMKYGHTEASAITLTYVFYDPNSKKSRSFIWRNLIIFQ